MIAADPPVMQVSEIPAAAIARAREELIRNADLWDDVTTRQDYPGSAHADTRSIYLRWAEEWTPEMIFESLSAEWCDPSAILVHTVAIARQVLVLIGAIELGRVMLVSLKPGGVITPHCDEGHYADYYDRFHVVIDSSHGNTFTVDGAKAVMFPGEVWWFNHQLEHTASNASLCERIHLIIDCVAPKYRAMRKGA